MQTLRGIFILAVFTITALIVIPWQSALLRLKMKRAKTLPQSYDRFLSRLFGMKIRVVGTPVRGGGVLMVANHTSYLDILALGGVATVSFIAKSEVQGWFFFGLMA